MWFFMVIFLLPFPCSAKDGCPRSVSMSQNGYVDVMFGQRFNLTCSFTCLTANHRVQLLKNKQLLIELSSLRETNHTVVLLLLIPAIQHNDSGQYKCQSDPPDVVSTVKVNVVYADELTVKETNNATDRCSTTPPSPPKTTKAEPQPEVSSEVKSPCSAQFSWNVPLWYLLCKMALFLICSLSVLLKKTC